MNIGQEIDKYRDEIIKEIQRLIQIRSVKDSPLPGKPYGEGIAKALEYMLALGRSMGFRTHNVDGYAGHIEYGEGEEMAAVLVHLDTVEEGQGWSVNPFEGVIRDGLIIGRGASDDKGPAVVAVYALAALRDRIPNPGRRIRIIFGTDEENGMSDMDYYFKKEPLPTYGFTPDAAYPIIHAEKGFFVIKITQPTPSSLSSILRLKGGNAPNMVPDRCDAWIMEKRADKEQMQALIDRSEQHESVEWCREEEQLHITYHGKPGHGSYPPSGVNAIVHFLEMAAASECISLEEAPLLSFLHQRIGNEAHGESLGIACEDPKHGKLTVNFASVAFDEGQANAVLNIRYPATHEGTVVLEKLQSALNEYGLEMEVTQYLAPLHVAEDHPLIRKLSKAYTTIMKEPAKLLSIGGGTYARKLQNRGVAFGAGFPGRIHGPGPHQPDECVSIDDLMQHGQICTQALYELQHTGDENNE